MCNECFTLSLIELAREYSPVCIDGGDSWGGGALSKALCCSSHVSIHLLLTLHLREVELH